MRACLCLPALVAGMDGVHMWALCAENSYMVWRDFLCGIYALKTLSSWHDSVHMCGGSMRWIYFPTHGKGSMWSVHTDNIFPHDIMVGSSVAFPPELYFKNGCWFSTVVPHPSATWSRYRLWSYGEFTAPKLWVYWTIASELMSGIFRVAFQPHYPFFLGGRGGRRGRLELSFSVWFVPLAQVLLFVFYWCFPCLWVMGSHMPSFYVFRHIYVCMYGYICV